MIDCERCQEVRGESYLVTDWVSKKLVSFERELILTKIFRQLHMGPAEFINLIFNKYNCTVDLSTIEVNGREGTKAKHLSSHWHCEPLRECWFKFVCVCVCMILEKKLLMKSLNFILKRKSQKTRPQMIKHPS